MFFNLDKCKIVSFRPRTRYHTRSVVGSVWDRARGIESWSSQGCLEKYGALFSSWSPETGFKTPRVKFSLYISFVSHLLQYAWQLCSLVTRTWNHWRGQWRGIRTTPRRWQPREKRIQPLTSLRCEWNDHGRISYKGSSDQKCSATLNTRFFLSPN